MIDCSVFVGGDDPVGKEKLMMLERRESLEQYHQIGPGRQVGGLALHRSRSNSSEIARKKPEWMSVDTGMWLDVTELCGNSL